MSSDIFNPKLIKVKDPIIQTNEKVVYPVIQGGAETTERVFNSNTYSTTSIQFTCPPPNPKTFVSRRFLLRLKCQFQVQISIGNNVQTNQPFERTGAGDDPLPGNFLLANGYDAFRQYPINSIIRTLNLTINGNTVTLPTNEIIKPLLLYHSSDRKLEARESSFSPSMRDQSMDYPDLVNTHINPLGKFGDGDYRDEGPRGSFPITPIEVVWVSGTTYQITFNADLVEELFISPLIFGGGRCQNEGFINVQSIDINITFDSSIAKCWSHCAGAITSIRGQNYYYDLASFEFDSATPFPVQPAILFRYVTPPYGMNIPRAVQYCYNVIDRYITDIKPPQGGQWAYNTVINNAISNNVQLNSIPRFLYLFIRRKYRNDRSDSFFADSYASISQVQINWNNKNALLANASQFQLYDISRKNGVDLSFPSWAALDMPNNYLYEAPSANSPDLGYIHGLGSVLCLEFGTDICLEPGESAGQVGTYNIYVQIQGTWKSYNYAQGAIKGNINGEVPTELELYMLFVTPAVYTIYDNAASQRIGVFSKQQAMNANYVAGVDYRDTQEMLMSGGFKFKKAFRKAKKGVTGIAKKGFKTVKGIAKPIVGDVKRVAQEGIDKGIKEGLAQIGMGMKRMKMGGCGSRGRGMAVAGRKRKRSKSRGKSKGPKKKKRKR